MKLVTALGAINTDKPNTTAEISNEKVPGHMTGKADPTPMLVKINANGSPDAWRANIGRQTNGEMQMLSPSKTQTNVMKP